MRAKFSFFQFCALVLLPAMGLAQLRVDLSTSSPDVEIIGKTSSALTGHALAFGDINGDHVQDLLIGAPGQDAQSLPGVGRVYVFFGGTMLPGALDLSSASPDLEIVGSQQHSGLGTAITVADVDGDGMDDIIVSEPGNSTADGDKVGTVSVIFGRSSFPALMTILDADVRIHGAAALDAFGEALAAGDLNNDAVADIVVGVRLADLPGRASAGKVLVIGGRRTWPKTMDMAVDASLLQVWGEGSSQLLGNAVAVSDLNNDGLQDLIIGNFKANTPHGVDAGKVYVILQSDSRKDTIDLAVDAADIVLSGAEKQDHFGISVLAGDFNGDTLTDLAVGARRADDGQPTNVGKVYVFQNTGTWPAEISLVNGAADVTVVGDASMNDLGMSLAVGDISGDDIADLFMGAPFSSPDSRTQAGESLLLFGRTTFEKNARLDASQIDVRFLGAQADDFLGNAVAIGDLNGDGRPDVVVAAEDAEPAGRVYIFHNDFITSVKETNSPASPPESFGLRQNYPNPFNAGTTITVEVPEGVQPFEVAIFNIRGQKVRGLFRGSAQPGVMQLTWHGDDDAGRSVGSSVYIVRLSTADDTRSVLRKMIYIK